MSRASRYQSARGQAVTAQPETELVTLRMTAATRETLLAALDEAAMGKEDRARECGCEGCEDCELRRQAADEYRQLAEIVGEAGAVSTGEVAGRDLPATPEDANPLRAAWIEASDRYDELLAQQDADPDAPLGGRVTAAYWARDRAFNAMYEGTPTAASREVDRIVDAHLAPADREGRPVTGWTRRARLAARRAQRLARTGAIRVQRAAGDLADKFRKRGRQAAVKDIAVMEMAGLAEKKNGKLLERSVTATLGRDRGPLPDPAWTAGYRDVAAARVPGAVRVRRDPEPRRAARPGVAGPDDIRWAHDTLGSRRWREEGGAARDDGERELWAEWDRAAGNREPDAEVMPPDSAPETGPRPVWPVMPPESSWPFGPAEPDAEDQPDPEAGS